MVAAMIWLKFYDGINDRGVMLLASRCDFFERKDGLTVECNGDTYLVPALTLERLASSMRQLDLAHVAILEL
jgi:hypothetical protein